MTISSLSQPDLNKLVQSRILEAVDYDKREALSFIQEKCSWLADRCVRCEKNKKLQKFYPKWKKLLTAYVTAEFNLGYYLSLDQEMADDLRKSADAGIGAGVVD